MRKRFGDTLVEVTLAIGIFSMVAIAVVAVVNNSTSGAQSSLEVTVTREQIDTQAEALRFIHGSYISDVKADVSSDKNAKANYTGLWRAITKRAILKSEVAEFIKPSTCSSLYGKPLKNIGFIINTRRLNEVKETKTNETGGTTIGEVMITPDNDNDSPLFEKNIFRPTVTYPRLVFNNNKGSTDALSDTDMSDKVMKYAEGLFIIPTIDEDSTTIVTDTTIQRGSAFFDFYIMSCWYPSNTERPSTISTVVRLYDPDAITETAQDRNVHVYFNGNGGSTESPMAPLSVPLGAQKTIPNNTYQRLGYKFDGWCTAMVESRSDCNVSSGRTYYTGNGSTYRAPNMLETSNDNRVELYAVWQSLPFDMNLIFNLSGGYDPSTGNSGTVTKTVSNIKVGDIINLGTVISPVLPGDIFKGWEGTNIDGDAYHYKVKETNLQEKTASFTAIWDHNYTVTYVTNSSWEVGSHTCSRLNGCTLSSDTPSRSGYTFRGWCTAPNNGTCNGQAYQSNEKIDGAALKNSDMTLYAIWSIFNETITISLDWSNATGLKDLDANIRGTLSNGTSFNATYNTTVVNDTIDGQSYNIAKSLTGIDCYGLTTSGIHKCANETYIINTLGGKDYYYYVKNYTYKTSRPTGAVVTVTSSAGTQTFYASDASGSGGCWNVFAYKDGKIIPRQTLSNYNYPETNY